MVSIKEELKSRGWNLTDDGIELCSEECGQMKDVKAIIKHALDMDLTEIGEKTIPDDINKSKDKEFMSPCVLQVVKVRNVSAPKANEESSVAPRMLQLHLTDGHKTCVGIEDSNIPKISLETPPGCKICLRGLVKIQNGLLLLNSGNVDFIRGKVDNIYKRWLAAKEASGFSRIISDVEEAPPPFVPFGNKITYKCNPATPSLQKSQSNENEEENKEFLEQRDAVIAEVSKTKFDISGKTFSGGSKSTDFAPPLQKEFPNRKFDTKSQNASQREHQIYKMQNMKIDENSCSQITQMGFSRSAAVNALQKFNNNLDQAIEHLLNPDDQGQGSSRPSRGDSRGGRSDRKGGRGRGRNRQSRDNEDRSDQRPSTSATLFDFLETKITPTSKQSSDDPSMSKPGSSKTFENDETNDDRLQEEYLVEYAKELSLVETHGGSGGGDVDISGYQSRSETDERRGIARYRGKSKDESNKTHEKPERSKRWQDKEQRDFERRDKGQRTDRREYEGDEKYSARHNHREDSGFRGGRGSRSRPRGERGRGRGRGRSYRTEESNDSKDYDRRDFYDKRNGYNHKPIAEQSSERKTDPTRKVPRNEYSQKHSFTNGILEHDQGNKTQKRPEFQRSPRDRYVDLPPRLQKKKMQNKKNLTLGETARQMRAETSNQVPENIPPPFPDQAFYHTVEQRMTFRQKPPSSHSYQDQRLQSRNLDQTEERFHQRPQEYGPVTWCAGMTCKAKYWEDNQFYVAEVTDVHPTKPTAVVKFMDYGNCEEVLFNDMLPHGDFEDDQSYHGPTGGLEFRRGRKGPTKYPNTENHRRGPTRPSQSLYQPPIHK
ncbi:tudor domain-containing protein 3-like isoform X2 [Clavelina lepadiformis]|uniref:Survival of motor neuron-related-splicing factor 30 n=1 Tax=Clavelina lepadiformis TaxID=159417 RepID=A0ABP0GZX3_CLALP